MAPAFGIGAVEQFVMFPRRRVATLGHDRHAWTVTTTPEVVARRAPPAMASPPVGTYMASSKVLPVGGLAISKVGQALPPAGTEVEM